MKGREFEACRCSIKKKKIKKRCVESGKKIGGEDSRMEGKYIKESTRERNPLLLMQ